MSVEAGKFPTYDTITADVFFLWIDSAGCSFNNICTFPLLSTEEG